MTMSSRLNTIVSIDSFGEGVVARNESICESIWLDVKERSDLEGWRASLSGKEKSSSLKLAIEPWFGLKESKKES